MRPVAPYQAAIFCPVIWYSTDGLGYHPYVSNGNAAAAVLLTAAILTGMHQAHGGSTRRHWSSPARHWSSPERAELGDARIPVRSVRTVRHDTVRRVPGRHVVRRSDVEQNPEVIVGYVDPRRGPAAFHRLTKVVEGDRVKVVRRDHSVAWFKVDSVRHLARMPSAGRHPEDDVRRAIARGRSSTGRPELRLISVRGADRPRRARDVVVSAHLDRPVEE